VKAEELERKIEESERRSRQLIAELVPLVQDAPPEVAAEIVRFCDKEILEAKKTMEDLKREFGR